ncbi:MAG TPA: cytochrome P450 [Stellaceae bacterium]|nr:cytochrome P450 [Stellaceae bacterium]
MSETSSVDRFHYPAPDVLERPFDFYAAMREEAPVYRVPGTDVFIVSRYDDLVYASQHPEIFSSKRVWMVSDDPEVARIRAAGFPDSNSLTATDPPGHQKFRTLAVKVFSPRRFAQLEPAVRSLANRLIDGFVADGEADLQRQYATPLPLTVIADLLGLDHADVRDLKRWSDDYSEAMASHSRPMPRHRVLECAQSLTDLQLYFSRKIEERRANPGDDTISDLVRANDVAPEPASHIELVDMIRIFLIGGNETTALAIGTLMHRLLEKPERWERLKQDPGLAAKAVEEGLRHDSPTQWTGRTTAVDTTLGGTHIPAGSRIYLMWGSGNRDGAHFSDRPEQFDVERGSAQSHLAFGFGPHFCAGAPLARMEMRITLELFLARLKNLRLSAKNEFRYHAHPILRGIEHLHVEFDPA